MSYLYSKTNRLDVPHNYMYTSFEGKALLHAYQSSRLDVIYRCVCREYDVAATDDELVSGALLLLQELFDAISVDSSNTFRALLEGGKIKIINKNNTERVGFIDLVKPLNLLSVTGPVKTLELLHALIAGQLTGSLDSNTKVWLDRLVQRFEVTKKLYELYPPGFRKGEGTNRSVRLYWLFSLALCLFYIRSNEIKYLSTLLKVSDLLCSLSVNELTGQIPEHGLLVVLAAEIVSVQQLASQKGVSFDSD